MAGKRQHYVPRFLQRGFLAPGAPDDHAWFHRRGVPAKLVGVRRIGVETYFYSRPVAGVKTLDDTITQLESGIQDDLAKCRTAPLTSALDGAVAGRLATHLVHRTALIRSVFEQGAQTILDGIVAVMGTPQGMRAHFGVDAPALGGSVSTIVDSLISTVMAKGLDVPRSLMERVVSFLLRERFDDLIEQVVPIAQQVHATFTRAIPGLIKTAHNNALAKSSFERWESQLSKLTWRVVAVECAILPDCIAIAREGSGPWMPLTLAGLGGITVCLVPIADTRILVGTGEGVLLPDLADFNVHAAACCDQFFIASRAQPDELAAHIGQRCAEAMTDAVQDALAMLPVADPAPDPAAVVATLATTDGSQGFSYALSAQGLERAADASALQLVVTTTVQEISRTWPLESLDGITFAEDYPAALAQLDRGDPSLAPDVSVPRPYGTPVAKCVDVVRNGERKHHLVLSAFLAQQIVSEEDGERALALHMLINMLGSVAYDARYARAFQGVSPAFPDAMVQLLHRASSQAPGRYATASMAAFADPTAGDRYATLFRDSLATAQSAIDAARMQYHLDKDMDALVRCATSHLQHVLDHAAEWCGHCDAAASGELPVADLMSPLAQAWELDRWIELFADDLRRMFVNSESFTAERVFALSRHVERLMWPCRLFPWPQDDGQVFVSVT